MLARLKKEAELQLKKKADAQLRKKREEAEADKEADVQAAEQTHREKRALRVVSHGRQVLLQVRMRPVPSSAADTASNVEISAVAGSLRPGYMGVS